MTALIIIAAITLLIFVLLASSITAELEYDQVFKFKIKYLFFTIAKDPLSPREQKKKKRKAEKKKRREDKKAKKQGKHVAEKKRRSSAAGKTNSPETKESEQPLPSAEKDMNKEKDMTRNRPEEKKQKKKSKITPELIFGIWGKAKPHVKRLFKKIRVTGVYADITVGGEDAAKTAISYGVHCAAVNGLAAFLDGMINFKAEKIDIKADFALEKSEYYAKATVKLRLSTLLHSGIWGAAAVYGELKNITAASEETDGSAPQKAA